jgi:uncharacterized protein
MEHAPPDPPLSGSRAGLAYALFLPPARPPGGVLVLHGAGSAKENHFDFARRCRAAGLAALVFDARGHGRSEGELGAGALDDVRTMCELLREHVPQVALRGSSMGGCLAIHAAARDPDIAAVVAICPAPERVLLRGLRSDEYEFRADREGFERLLGSLDLVDAVARLGPETELLLLHARGDGQVPCSASERLFEAAHEPKRILLMPDGDHSSVQHDPDVQALSCRFVERALERRTG